MSAAGADICEKSLAAGSLASPSALEIATHAVSLLEDNPLFNSGHGAVFTRDGINELEASVMVSRGRAKRAVGVMGLRRVRNPITLARAILERGDEDLAPKVRRPKSQSRSGGEAGTELDVPSAQGHTQLHGETAEQLARMYGLDMVDPSYFFTQQRWDEHVRALEREREGQAASCSWSENEYLPQGTCGAVALDEDGVVCVATSTGGLTNKLTGRIGDTPAPGAGFWAEEWTEDGDPTSTCQRQGYDDGLLRRVSESLSVSGLPLVTLTRPLMSVLADCLPTPQLYSPLPPSPLPLPTITTTRSMAASGTGNGDSFLRTTAVRTVAAMARFRPESTARSISHVTGPNGELQRSAGDRWGRTGEGEGGMIGIECAVVRDAEGRILETRADILMDFNCGGMFRGWIDEDGQPVMSIWTNGGPDDLDW